MKIFRLFVSALCAALIILISLGPAAAKNKYSRGSAALNLAAETSAECPPEGCPAPKKEPGDKEGDEEYEYEYEKISLDYRRIYYSFGACGSYFIIDAGININSVIGAFTNIEFRFSRIFSLGFDSYYGWLSGSGNQYLSTFNPGLKIYPMAYRNPKFEPFLYFGGHAMDVVFGDSALGKAGMGQGGFSGLGFRLMPEAFPMGIEFFARADFLYMQKPGGGRGLAIPIFGFLGVTY